MYQEEATQLVKFKWHTFPLKIALQMSLWFAGGGVLVSQLSVPNPQRSLTCSWRLSQWNMILTQKWT